MWAGAVVLILLLPAVQLHYFEEELPEEYRNSDFEDDETEITMPMLATTPIITTTPMDTYTRVRRFGKPDIRRTLNPQELRDVKGVLRDIFANRRIDGVATEVTKTSTIFELSDKYTNQSDTSSDKLFNKYDKSYNQTLSYDHSEKLTAFNATDDQFDNAAFRSIKDILQLPTEDQINLSSPTPTPQQYDWKSTDQEMSINGRKEERSALKEAVRGLRQRIQTWQPVDPGNEILTTLLEYLDSSTEKTLSAEEVGEVQVALHRFISSQKQNTRSPIHLRNSTLMIHQHSPTDETTESNPDSLLSTDTEMWEVTSEGERTAAETYEYLDADNDHGGLREAKKALSPEKKNTTKSKKPKKSTKWTKSTLPSGMFVNGVYHTFPKGWPYLSRCPTTLTTPMRVDFHGMLWLIANLTYDYDMQLVQRFNESLLAYSVPTCGTGTRRPGQGDTTPFDYDNATVVAKCFVCGLTSTHIPRDSYCADAFAGDFLPLTPVDPRARGHIARYRKYCRYMDVRDTVEVKDRPRAIYGRFSGGCAVRWTDLSGVYTQRTCRIKRRAITGNHFGSKRMAKLEMALNHVDNGCIISPMATLLPLSRGISLYARFHACVCTGAWCNRSVQNLPWMVNVILILALYDTLNEE